MSRDIKPTKTELMAAYEYDERRMQAEKIFANRVSSCFKCSKANPTEIILNQNDIRQYIDDRILFVHDNKFNCDLLKYKNKSYLYNCKNGNKLAPEKCSTCVNAIDPLTVEYVNTYITKSRITERRVVYRCLKHNEEGHYYRSTFSCSDYKEK